MAHIAEITRKLKVRRTKYEQEASVKTPLGVKPIDIDIKGGINLDSGGIYTISGLSGSRKTSIVLNFIINMCIDGKNIEGTNIYIDTLESGMTVERYTETLVSMLATKIILTYFLSQDRALNSFDNIPDDINWVKNLLIKGIPDQIKSGDDIIPFDTVPAKDLINNIGYYNNSGKFIRLLGPLLSVDGRENKKYISYQTPLQKRAISLATQMVAEWPLIINGLSEYRVLTCKDVLSVLKSKERWLNYTKDSDRMILVIDHISAYITEGSSDYNSQHILIGALKDTIFNTDKSKVNIFLLEQAGISSQNADPKNIMNTPHTRGGNVTLEDAQIGMYCKYIPAATQFANTLNKNKPVIVMDWSKMLLLCKKSRVGYISPILLGIEPHTGTLLGTYETLVENNKYTFEDYFDEELNSQIDF